MSRATNLLVIGAAARATGKRRRYGKQRRIPSRKVQRLKKRFRR
jgi:hypothetical protein